MNLTNIFRDFGSDALLVVIMTVPLLLVFFLVRRMVLTRTGSSHPVLNASLECVLILYVVAAASVTLIPKNYVELPGSRISWDLWASDLTSTAERTQVIGNLALLAPIVFLIIVRYRPLNSWLAGLSLSVIIPVAVELAQAHIISGRVAAVEDVVLGGIGCLIATVLATVIVRRFAGELAASAVAPAAPVEVV